MFLRKDRRVKYLIKSVPNKFYTYLNRRDAANRAIYKRIRTGYKTAVFGIYENERLIKAGSKKNVLPAPRGGLI